jgi:hypothetical protein
MLQGVSAGWAKAETVDLYGFLKNFKKLLKKIEKRC